MNSKTGEQVAENYLAHFGTEEFDILKTEPMSEEDLAQSGILGMKWGIRRSKEQLAVVNPTKKKRLSELTDKELDNAIARLQKEKLYKDLVSSSGSKGKANPAIQKGESISKKILLAFGASLAKNFAEKAGTYLGEKVTSSRKVKFEAKADNDKARYALINEQLEKKRRDKAAKEAKETKINDIFKERKKQRKAMGGA